LGKESLICLLQKTVKETVQRGQDERHDHPQGGENTRKNLVEVQVFSGGKRIHQGGEGGAEWG